MSLLLPVGPRTMSSWSAHINRRTPSSEPGTDFYCPAGTPIIAPADGVIWGWGNSVMPATGRWVGIDFDNGMGFRTMHHQRNVITSGRVHRGQVYAISGSSGYGSEYFGESSRNAAFWNNTGGDHVHATLWPTHDHRYGYSSPGKPYTIDLMKYIGGASGGTGDDDMSVQDIFDARDGDGRNMLDLGRQIRADLGRIQAELARSARLNAEADYPAFVAMQQRAYRYDVRQNGVGADWKLGPSVFELLNGAQNKAVSEEQVKAIADAITAQIGTPTVSIDYSAVAEAVNNDAAKRLSE